jgi:hypothetical protein
LVIIQLVSRECVLKFIVSTLGSALYLCWNISIKCVMIVLKMFCILMYKNFHVLLVSHKHYESGTSCDGWDGNSIEQCSCKSVTAAWLSKKSPVFCGTLRFIKTHQQGMLYTWLMCTYEIGGVLVWLLCSQDPASSAYPKPNKSSPHQESYFKTCFNIIHPPKARSLKWFSFYSTKFVWISVLARIASCDAPQYIVFVSLLLLALF